MVFESVPHRYWIERVTPEHDSTRSELLCLRRNQRAYETAEMARRVTVDMTSSLNSQGSRPSATGTLMTQDPLAVSLAALTQFVVGKTTMRETLDKVAAMCVASMPGTEFAGITMMGNGRPVTAVFTDPLSPEIDQAQYKTGKGPCLEAFRTGEVYQIDSTRDDPRWPAFNRACLDHGVGSTLSIPLTVENERQGALNFYSAKPAGYGDAERRTAALFGAQAAIVLANAAVYWEVRNLADNLEIAMTTRSIVEEAKGIIMSTMRCGSEQAFAVLVAQSQQQNEKLSLVAARLVEHAARGT